MSETITTPAVRPTIRERVERGIAWLDEVRPDWRDSVNRSALDISDSDNCLLGQVFWAEARQSDPYWSGFTYVHSSGHFKDATGSSISAQWMIDHGFEEDDESYNVLTVAWLHLMAS